MIKKYPHNKKGEMLIYLLIIVSLFAVMMLPVINNLALKTKVTASTVASEQALQIAEAGINYYQWHLAHFPTDYYDGNAATSTGPYVHTYTDLDNQTVLGKYSLTITPPSTGSTIVTIQSTGATAAYPGVTRTITAKYGIPSLAQYSFLSNDVIWIGNNENISGLMQSNNGIRFDGTTNAAVESAKATYTCPSTQGSPCPATENGVWGGASQTTQSFWTYPVPSVDFSSITSSLATMENSAETSGIFLPPSNAQGYSLVFLSNGTVNIYKVTSLTSNPTGWDVYNNPQNQYTDYNARTLLYNKAVPANGIIYIEDTTWVEGTVKGRVMVAAATLPYNPSTAPSIYIPNNLVYAAKDGTNALGLLAQNNIVVTYHAPSTIEIDAALVAQNGSAEFFYYPNDIKTTISIFGAIMTYGQWTWTWVDGSNNTVSGYNVTNDTYDGNLLYSPPPGFPLSTSGYQQLSWNSN